MELATTCTRVCMPFCATHLYCFTRRTSRCDTSLRTIQNPCCNWQEIAGAFSVGTGFGTPSATEDVHRYRGNGAGSMTTLRTAAPKLLRLAGFQPIRTGMQAVMLTTVSAIGGFGLQASGEPSASFLSVHRRNAVCRDGAICRPFNPTLSS